MSDLAIVNYKEIRLKDQIEVNRERVFGWNNQDAVARVATLDVIAPPNIVSIPWARIAYAVRAIDPVGDAKRLATDSMLSAAVPKEVNQDAVVTDIKAQLAKNRRRR